MLRLLTDENFPGDIVRGLLQRVPGLDLVRVQDVGLMSTPDPDILQWAADHDRIVLSRDKRTLSVYAWERVARGLLMPGVLLLRGGASTGQAIDGIELIVLTTEHHEWVNQVEYIPF